MAELKLTRGRVAIVDACYLPALLAMGKWCFDGRYAQRGYYVNGQHKTERLHRAVARLCGIIGEHIDHRNCNKLDCRRRNLRAATPRQTLLNRPLRSDNTSGYKGVSRHRNKWMAKFNGRSLGVFTTPKAASQAYMRAISGADRPYVRAK